MGLFSLAGLEALTIGAVTALAFEVLKAWELRGKLHLKKYQSLIRSPLFWLLIAGMSLASGWFAWMFNAHKVTAVTPFEIGISAVAARSVLRSAAEAFVANGGLKLGDGDVKFSLKDAFA